MPSEKKDIKFEEGLKELEKVVSDLESGELSLEEVLKRYETGVGLSRLLSGKLEEASKKIEILTKDLEGNLRATSFEPGLENRQAKKRVSAEPDTDSLI